MNDKIVETVTRVSPAETITITTTRWVVNGEPEDRGDWLARHNTARTEFLNPPVDP